MRSIIRKTIRVDQDSEFVSKDLDLWAYQRGVILDFARPGKPTDNAFIECLNGKFRAECLNAHWFMNVSDAQRKCEIWRRDYNEIRPQRDRQQNADRVGQPITRGSPQMTINQKIFSLPVVQSSGALQTAGF